MLLKLLLLLLLLLPVWTSANPSSTSQLDFPRAKQHSWGGMQQPSPPAYSISPTQTHLKPLQLQQVQLLPPSQFAVSPPSLELISSSSSFSYCAILLLLLLLLLCTTLFPPNESSTQLPTSVVLINLWIPSPPTRAPTKHTLSQLPQLLLLLPPANAHSIQSSNSAARVVKGEEMKTQRKRGREKHPKNRKNKQTNRGSNCHKSMGKVVLIRNGQVHEIHDNKVLHFSHTQKIHHITQN